MEQTFEQMKDAAKEVHRRFYKYCTSSFNDIVNTDNVRDLRRVVIRYAIMFQTLGQPAISARIMRMYWRRWGCGSSFTSMAVYGCIWQTNIPDYGMEQPPL